MHGGGCSDATLHQHATLPLASSLACVASPVSVRGVTENVTAGIVPPVEKKASRISAARWNSRRVATEKTAGNLIVDPPSPLWPERSARLARCCVKNRSKAPLGRTA